jgi:hypothetical protein
MTIAVAGVVLIVLGLSVLYVFELAGTAYALQGTLIAGAAAVLGGAATVLFARRRTDRAVMALLLALVVVNWTFVLKVLPSVEAYKPAVPLAQAITDRARPEDVIVHYDVALPSMVFYLRRRVETVWSSNELLELVRSGKSAFAVLPEERYLELAGELGGSACVVLRQPTFDAKLREVLARRAPSTIVLLSTRCAPSR